MTELNVTVTELVQNFANSGKDFDKNSTSIQNTDELMRLISEFAATSILLGLNATIEAAKAEVHTSVLTVAGTKLREMAVTSAQAVKDIKGILYTLRCESNNADGHIDSITAASSFING
ncbi:MAG: methyl-accepting chemotaxis sensory transducer [Firmicutes bacterium]|nr:methyl-accepting chemotaxis sensory transducer [Bacillota bacterium]